MRVEARFARRLPIGVLSPSSQCDKHGAGIALPLADTACNFESVELWQPDVEQDYLRPESGCRVHGFETVVCRDRFMTTETQKRAERVRGIAIVIDHEDAARRVRRRYVAEMQLCGRMQRIDPR